jgi:hypothetical protein
VDQPTQTPGADSGDAVAGQLRARAERLRVTLAEKSRELDEILGALDEREESERRHAGGAL